MICEFALAFPFSLISHNRPSFRPFFLKSISTLHWRLLIKKKNNNNDKRRTFFYFIFTFRRFVETKVTEKKHRTNMLNKIIYSSSTVFKCFHRDILNVGTHVKMIKTRISHLNLIYINP